MTEYYVRARAASDALRKRMGDTFWACVRYNAAKKCIKTEFSTWIGYQVEGEDYETMGLVFEKDYTLCEFMNSDVEEFVDRVVIDYTFGV
jgi:hypothetical protein